MKTYVVALKYEEFKAYTQATHPFTHHVVVESDMFGDRPSKIVFLKSAKYLDEFEKIRDLAEQLESRFGSEIEWVEE